MGDLDRVSSSEVCRAAGLIMAMGAEGVHKQELVDFGWAFLSSQAEQTRFQEAIMDESLWVVYETGLTVTGTADGVPLYAPDFVTVLFGKGGPLRACRHKRVSCRINGFHN